MKSRLYFTLFISALVSILSCNEDNLVGPTSYATIRGRVLDVVSQQPVQNALVTLVPSSRVLITNSIGEFRFDSVLAGTYTLQSTKIGYTSQVASISVNTGISPLVTILLTDNKLLNQPPTVPILVSPAINSTTQVPSVTVKWKATDPTRDTLTYDVLLFKAGATTPTSSYTGLKTDTLAISGLEYNTTYLWQVIAKDRINTVNGPIWSFATSAYPDYSFVFTQLLKGQYQIFASNGSGTAVQLTHSGSNWRPIVSPNKQQIAFISNVANDLQLFVMNTDGSNQRQVTTIPVNGLSVVDLTFSWSPDGSQLVYPSNNRLLVIGTDGTGLRLVTQAATGRLFAGCDWTPQGNELAVRTTGASVYDNEITIMRPDGSEVRSVYVRRNKRVGNPVYAVDGRQIVFSADSSGFINDQGRQLDSRLYLLNLITKSIMDLSVPSTTAPQGSAASVVKAAGTNDLDPRFSPSGSQIIFTNSVNTLTGARSVYAIDLTGAGATNRRLIVSAADMPYWRQQ